MRGVVERFGFRVSESGVEFFRLKFRRAQSSVLKVVR